MPKDRLLYHDLASNLVAPRRELYLFNEFFPFWDFCPDSANDISGGIEFSAGTPEPDYPVVRSAAVDDADRAEFRVAVIRFIVPIPGKSARIGPLLKTFSAPSQHRV